MNVSKLLVEVVCGESVSTVLDRHMTEEITYLRGDTTWLLQGKPIESQEEYDRVRAEYKSLAPNQRDDRDQEALNTWFRGVQAADVEAQAAVDAARYETFGFLDGMSPMAAKNALDALMVYQGFSGEYGSRKDVIYRLVKNGWRANLNTDRFESPDGTFYTSRDLTKTGMDYANYLAYSAGL